MTRSLIIIMHHPGDRDNHDAEDGNGRYPPRRRDCHDHRRRLLTLHMPNCFKDYKRYIRITYHTLIGFCSTELPN